MKVKLSAYDRTDLCVGAVVVGFVLCISAVSLVAIAGSPVPMALRTGLATVGVLTFLCGIARLHQAASGRVPFRDDTRRVLPLTEDHRDGML